MAAETVGGDPLAALCWAFSIWLPDENIEDLLCNTVPGGRVSKSEQFASTIRGDAWWNGPDRQHDAISLIKIVHSTPDRKTLLLVGQILPSREGIYNIMCAKTRSIFFALFRDLSSCGGARGFAHCLWAFNVY